MGNPIIKIGDIETGKGYLEVPFYQLKQYSNYLSHKYIKRHPWIVCASFLDLGRKRADSFSVLDSKTRFKKCHYDDYAVTKWCRDQLNECDIFIAHNGEPFDWKFIIGRCLVHGIEPPKKPIIIDTLKIARKEFKIASNSLDYLARYLGVDAKGQSPDWDKIKDGDVAEIKRCIKYNKQDCYVLRDVYLKLRPYATNHPNLNALLNEQDHDVCPKCAHWDLLRQGFHYTKAGKYQQYQCDPNTGGCGGWSTAKKNLKKVNMR